MFAKATEYALRAAIYIAQKSSKENKLGIQEISTAIDSPPSFTAKILQSLTKDHHVVRSVRGPNGGFYMTDVERNLPVRSILVAVDDDSVFSKCILGLHECSELNPCPMHGRYKSIREQLTKLFEEKTIGELAEAIKRGKYAIGNLGS